MIATFSLLLLWKSCMSGCETEIQSRLVCLSGSGPQKLDAWDPFCKICCFNSTSGGKKGKKTDCSVLLYSLISRMRNLVLKLNLHIYINENTFRDYLLQNECFPVFLFFSFFFIIKSTAMVWVAIKDWSTYTGSGVTMATLAHFQWIKRRQ